VPIALETPSSISPIPPAHQRSRLQPETPKRLLTAERLSLREAELRDSAFFLTLLNEPGWKRFIRQHDISTVESARQYLQDKILSMYEEHGYGLWVMELHSTGTPIGICGLVKRTEADPPDLGFALLERYQGNGYVAEAARAAVRFAHEALGLSRLDAITNPENSRSIAVLQRLGFRYRCDKVLEDGAAVAVYSRAADAAVPEPSRK
jgi:ribosomal-protein-alanine N-acetyltransferase